MLQFRDRVGFAAEVLRDGVSDGVHGDRGEVVAAVKSGSGVM